MTDTYHQIFTFPPQSPCIMDAGYKQARDKSQTFASIQYPSLYSESDTTISLIMTDTITKFLPSLLSHPV